MHVISYFGMNVCARMRVQFHDALLLLLLLLLLHMLLLCTGFGCCSIQGNLSCSLASFVHSSAAPGSSTVAMSICLLWHERKHALCTLHTCGCDSSTAMQALLTLNNASCSSFSASSNYVCASVAAAQFVCVCKPRLCTFARTHPCIADSHALATVTVVAFQA